MNVLIIEDEILLQQRLTRILNNIDQNINIIQILSSVKEAISFFENNIIQIDLILSDIQLGDGTTFQIFQKTKIISPIIFITSHERYLLKAFEVNAIDYLLKPVKQDELEKSINKLKTLNDFNQNKVNEFINNYMTEVVVPENSTNEKPSLLGKLKNLFNSKK